MIPIEDVDSQNPEEVHGLLGGGRSDLDRAATNGQGSPDWAPKANLDKFFFSMYNYYVDKGFWCCVAYKITSVAVAVFTMFFSIGIILLIYWAPVIHPTCVDSDSCAELKVILWENILGSMPGFWGLLLILYVGVTFGYSTWLCASSWSAIRDAHRMRLFFNKELGIQDEELQTIEWHVVAEKMVDHQRSTRISLLKDQDPLDITNRILRKENYMIALMNEDIMDLSVSLPYNLPWLSRHVSGEAAGSVGSVSMGKTLEWNIKNVLYNSMFDSDSDISETFTARQLKWWFRFWGCVNLLATPFTLVFMIVLFFLKHAEEFYSKKNVMGPRQWTPLARWKLREFNELPHLFEQRLNASHEAATNFLAQFPQTLQTITARFVAYIAGAFVAVLFLLMLLDSPILFFYTIYDRTLLSYLAVFSGILGVSRALIDPEGTGFNPEAAMRECVKHTHYMPEEWRGKYYTYKVRDEFKMLYSPRTINFFREVQSVLVTPFVMFFSLSDCADDIVRFVRDYSTTVKGVGAVCAYAQFDFSKYGDPTYLPPKTRGDGQEEKQDFQPLSQSFIQEQQNRRSTQLKPAAQGKMEKSFLNFSINHPNWKSNAQQGTRLIQSLSELQFSPSTNLGDQAPHSAPVAPTAPIAPEAPTADHSGAPYDRVGGYRTTAPAGKHPMVVQEDQIYFSDEMEMKESGFDVENVGERAPHAQRSNRVVITQAGNSPGLGDDLGRSQIRMRGSRSGLSDSDQGIMGSFSTLLERKNSNPNELHTSALEMNATLFANIEQIHDYQTSGHLPGTLPGTSIYYQQFLEAQHLPTTSPPCETELGAISSSAGGPRHTSGRKRGSGSRSASEAGSRSAPGTGSRSASGDLLSPQAPYFHDASSVRPPSRHFRNLHNLHTPPLFDRGSIHHLPPHQEQDHEHEHEYEDEHNRAQEDERDHEEDGHPTGGSSPPFAPAPPVPQFVPAFGMPDNADDSPMHSPIEGLSPFTRNIGPHLLQNHFQDPNSRSNLFEKEPTSQDETDQDVSNTLHSTQLTRQEQTQSTSVDSGAGSQSQSQSESPRATQPLRESDSFDPLVQDSPKSSQTNQQQMWDKGL